MLCDTDEHSVGRYTLLKSEAVQQDNNPAKHVFIEIILNIHRKRGVYEDCENWEVFKHLVYPHRKTARHTTASKTTL